MTEKQQQGLYASLYGLNSLLQVSGAMTASRIAARESKLEQKKIEVMSKSREAERKKQLADAMASVNAMSGIKNTMAFEGSPYTVLKEMESKVEQDLDQDQFITDLQKTTQKYRGKQKQAGYQSQAAQSMLSSGLNLMESL